MILRFSNFAWFSSFSVNFRHVWQKSGQLDLMKWAETFRKYPFNYVWIIGFLNLNKNIWFPASKQFRRWKTIEFSRKYPGPDLNGFSSIRANFRHLTFSKSASHHLKWFPEAWGSSPNDSWMILRFSIFSWFSSFSSFFWTRSGKVSRARLHQMSWNFQEISFQLRLNYWISQSQ